MRPQSVIIALSLALVAGRSTAIATVTIDDFSTTPQGPLVRTAPGDIGVTTGSWAAGGGILGVERDIRVFLMGGVGGDGVTVLVASGYDHSMDATATAQSRAVWDGADGDPFTVDYTGLGGVDLTQSGTQYAFEVQIAAAGAGGVVVFDVYTDATNASSDHLFFPGGAINQTYVLPYADFGPVLGSGADFTNVGAIAMMVDGSTVPGLDVVVGFIRTTSRCGDEVIDTEEECDDGNTEHGDGCSSTCMVEDGWDCTGEPSTCTVTCGDGLIVGSEECDDGATEDGDGCSSTCTVEEGFICQGEPSVCFSSNIPTVSEWGLASMTLLILSAGTLVLRRPQMRRA